MSPGACHVALAGAGLSGAVIARTLAEAGHRCSVFESRRHLAGNCHTERDPATGVMLHAYGPHIFHTDDDEVWALVNRYMRFVPCIHRVKAVARGQVFALPINLLTINQFFGRAFSPAEARAHLEALAQPGPDEPSSFEAQALRFVGRELYEAFFRGYTRKQWGVDPAELPASILRRLPLRFNYDDNYFSHRHQGLPERGYTEMVARLLDHPGISVQLGRALAPSEVGAFDHVFWSGPLDAFFGHDQGRLPYRTLDFERVEGEGDLQGCAVLNQCDESVPWTRTTEHKHLMPWESHARSVVWRETSRACGPDDLPYYPVHLPDTAARLAGYQARAQALAGQVSFVGRLGSFRYLDMDASIRLALDAARAWLARGG